MSCSRRTGRCGRPGLATFAYIDEVLTIRVGLTAVLLAADG
jgi:hypothetical protein